MKIDFGMLRTICVNKIELWQSKSMFFMGGQIHRIFYYVDEIKRK